MRLKTVLYKKISAAMDARNKKNIKKGIDKCVQNDLYLHR